MIRTKDIIINKKQKDEHVLRRDHEGTSTVGRLLGLNRKRDAY